MAKDKDRKPGFEESLKRLEEIVAAMESGSLPLDQALERYEEGIRLARFCARTLDDAEKRIEILAKGGSGEAEVKPFSPGAGAEDPGEAPPRPAKRRSGDEEQFLL